MHVEHEMATTVVVEYSQEDVKKFQDAAVSSWKVADNLSAANLGMRNHYEDLIQKMKEREQVAAAIHNETTRNMEIKDNVNNILHGFTKAKVNKFISKVPHKLSPQSGNCHAVKQYVARVATQINDELVMFYKDENVVLTPQDTTPEA